MVGHWAVLRADVTVVRSVPLRAGLRVETKESSRVDSKAESKVVR